MQQRAIALSLAVRVNARDVTVEGVNFGAVSLGEAHPGRL